MTTKEAYKHFNDVRNPLPPEFSIYSISRNELLKILTVINWLEDKTHE